MPYKPSEIEPHWQRYWDEHRTFVAVEDRARPKFYALDMFPYPSGKGLHVGHPAGYTASDVVSRYKRAKGFNVLHPMGFDSFGLPAEQKAISEGVPPQQSTAEALETFRGQLKRLGYSYDWTREVSTCDPSYYKWTQHIFARLHAKGLAYQADSLVNWCPALGTVLANDEVIDGKSERGGHPVERRTMKQWMLRITAYAERLLEGHEQIDWPESSKEAQRNWIGRSQGAQVDFAVEGSEHTVTVFTTRPDTLWGVTYMVLSPEHPLVGALTTEAQRAAVEKYRHEAGARSDVERQKDKKKTGVFTGSFAVNPVNGERVPLWIGDYVLMGYGTGAIMAVPGHDERDWDFARAMDLPIREVISGGNVQEAAYSGEGAMVHSGPFDGTPTKGREAVRKVIAWLEERKLGRGTTTFKMRDWAFARQRYWGEPIPVLEDAEGRVVRALELGELPLELPAVADYKPTGTGDSPLATAKDWVHVQDPKTGQALLRETDTMPGSAGSSWYFLRYCDPQNNEELCSREKSDYWMPVDLYVGGKEHLTGHLLYSRMWQKFLKDEGLVRDEEPFARLRHQGMILGEGYKDERGNEHGPSAVEHRDGKAYLRDSGAEVKPAAIKMGKRYGNVVDPDVMIRDFGADALRLYLCFLGPLEQDKPWQSALVDGKKVYPGMEGQRAFLRRAWRLFFTEPGEHESFEDKPRVEDVEPSDAELRVLHKCIQKVGRDIESLDLNTAVSALHVAVRDLAQLGCRARSVLEPLAQLFNPFAPHFAEELWARGLGRSGGISEVPWPAVLERYTVDETITIPVQVNGKTRGTVDVPRDADQDAVHKAALALEAVSKTVEGKSIARVIWVPGRMLNLVVK